MLFINIIIFFMFLSLIIFPFINFFFISFFGRFLGREGIFFFGIFFLLINLFFSFFLYFEVILNNSIVSIKLFKWILFDIYSIDIGFYFDNITCIMLCLIMFISCFVHLYSFSYLFNDPFFTRFFSYLSLFTFFMIFLVTSDNMVQLFFGWEGVGLSSYLLINFWFTRILANKAALKAMIMNRISDIIFFFSIVFIFLVFKTTDFILLFNLLPFFLNKEIIYFFKTFKFIDIFQYLY